MGRTQRTHTFWTQKRVCRSNAVELLLTSEVCAMSPTFDLTAQSEGMSMWTIVAHRRHRPLFLASTSNAAVFPASFSRMRVAFFKKEASRRRRGKGGGAGAGGGGRWIRGSAPLPRGCFTVGALCQPYQSAHHVPHPPNHPTIYPSTQLSTQKKSNPPTHSPIQPNTQPSDHLPVPDHISNKIHPPTYPPTYPPTCPSIIHPPYKPTPSSAPSSPHPPTRPPTHLQYVEVVPALVEPNIGRAPL